MNKQNLIPNTERTPSELREITQNGGIASGRARRKKVLMRSMLSELLQKGAFSRADLKMLERYGMDADEVDQAGLALMGLIDAAKSGSVAAMKQILEMTGEDARLKIEQARLKIEKEKLKFLKEKDGSDDLNKLDEILEKLDI